MPAPPPPSTPPRGAVGPRAGEAAIGFGLLALALYVIRSASAMPVGTVALPGPALFPLALGTLLALVALGLVVRAGVARPHGGPVAVVQREVVVALLALATTAWAFERLGALLTLGLLVTVLARGVGRAPWWQAVVAGAVAAGLVWAAFVRVLGLQLPAIPF